MTIKEIFDELNKEQFLSLENSGWCKFTREELEDIYETKDWFNRMSKIQPVVLPEGTFR